MPSATCQLCYRKCSLAEEETGWCGARANQSGQVVPTEYGVISSTVRQIRGYGPDPFLTYKPGATSLFLGGLRCSAGCSFCMSTNLVHAPARAPWAVAPSAAATADSLWYGQKALLDPVVAVDAAEHWQCSQILFGINEPLVTAEWTLNVAYEARQRGLDVALETNGFSDPRLIANCGHLFQAVDVGVKGSADPVFYERHMRAPGAVPHVKEALLAWREAGVHLIVGDVIAPPHMQTDEAFERAAGDFYRWVAEHLGPRTPVLVTQMMPPGPAQPGAPPAMPLTRAGDGGAYAERMRRAEAIATEVGLAYAHGKYAGSQTIRCHSCGGPLLRFRERCTRGWAEAGSAVERFDPCVMPRLFCPWWSHQQFVTDGHCDHCETAVPIVALSRDELQREREKVASIATDQVIRTELTAS